jgi:hypothetical protein
LDITVNFAFPLRFGISKIMAKKLKPFMDSEFVKE